MGILLSLLLAAGVAPPVAPTSPAPAQITVAAAADLTFAFREVAARFERESGSHVNLTFGSSGNFFSQIQNGAPYDLFFSADTGYPAQLEAGGWVEPGSRHVYAVGRLVLWVPDDSRLDLRQGLRALLDPRVHKIAIANPAHAPYGRAAMAALRHDGLAEKVRGKLVLGESVAQAAQFALSRDADAGILSLSLAVAPAMKDNGRYVEVPPSSYPALEQACVILKGSRHPELARRFMEFVRKPEAVALMRRYGFSAPDSGAARAR